MTEKILNRCLCSDVCVWNERAGTRGERHDAACIKEECDRCSKRLADARECERRVRVNGAAATLIRAATNRTDFSTIVPTNRCREACVPCAPRLPPVAHPPLNRIRKCRVSRPCRGEWDGARGAGLPAHARCKGHARRSKLCGKPPCYQEESERRASDADHPLIVRGRRR